ncbi:MAG: DUF309 domain-containing protein [Acidilobaceae archaeon]|nr:DUF309 domain-containing protein [Acidilobaceae archaeon]MCX8165892.1 DUF309 domain-containing protein [Acidilobaceae archaeon]MDW7974534.1 DUF309 domain-containing protein [Sulfolobales archaeon]
MRLLMIFEKSEDLSPEDAERIATSIRSRFPSATVRIASRHIEIAIITGGHLGNLPFSGTPLIVRELGKGESREDLETLVTSERFWEAHELLEGLWKVAERGRREKLERAIKVVAALSKAQEGKLEAAKEILRRGNMEGEVGELVVACYRGERVGEKAWELVRRELNC